MLPLVELQAIFGADEVLTDAERVQPYGRDESDTPAYPPAAVVFARSADQVARLMQLCSRERIPVTPCGARTGKSGGSLPIHGGVALSFEKMNRIRSISPVDLTAVVEPGVILEELQTAVEGQGLFYPPDPNSQATCTLGGNIAENAGGPRALKYGVTRDYVLGLEWVTPAGELLRVGRRTIKGVAGYDLVGLFVGSEGTLGVATEITLQVIPLPRFVRTALLLFPSTLAGARGVNAILAAGLLPRTLEFLDSVAIAAVDGRGYRFPAGTQACVIAEVDGSDDDALLAEIQRLADAARTEGANEVLVAQNEAQRRDIWACRRQVSPALRAYRPAKLSEDIVVPRSAIPEMIERTQAIGKALGLMVATYGHAGDGNLHANVLYGGPSERALADQAVEQILRAAVDLGGTITGEHGVGIAKKPFLSIEQSPGLIALQRGLQRHFDPLGIMNPGKIFPDE